MPSEQQEQQYKNQQVRKTHRCRHTVGGPVKERGPAYIVREGVRQEVVYKDDLHTKTNDQNRHKRKLNYLRNIINDEFKRINGRGIICMLYIIHYRMEVNIISIIIKAWVDNERISGLNILNFEK